MVKSCHLILFKMSNFQEKFDTQRHRKVWLTHRKRTHPLHFLCFPPRGSNYKQLTANLALHFYTDFLPNKQDYINCCTETN